MTRRCGTGCARALGSEARDAAIDALERDLTAGAMRRIVRDLLRREGIPAARVGVVGFHGHTILHRPERRGPGRSATAACWRSETGIDVVARFPQRRRRGGRAGRAARAGSSTPRSRRSLAKPLAMLNIGGVANVTWIGPDGRR